MLRVCRGEEGRFPSEPNGDEAGRSGHAQGPLTPCATSPGLHWCDHTWMNACSPFVCMCVMCVKLLPFHFEH